MKEEVVNASQRRGEKLQTKVMPVHAPNSRLHFPSNYLQKRRLLSTLRPELLGKSVIIGVCYVTSCAGTQITRIIQRGQEFFVKVLGSRAFRVKSGYLQKSLMFVADRSHTSEVSRRM